MDGDRTDGGVVFPQDPGSGGKRSTSRLGRDVVADALRAADPVGARAAELEANWRRGYPAHFRRLVEAGLLSADAAIGIARDGLDSLHRRMRYIDANGHEGPLDQLATQPPGPALTTETVTGRGEPEPELSVPLHGHRLRGDDLLRQLDTWVDSGAIEPSCAQAIRTVIAHPEWLRLAGRSVVVLGAGAEMGPLQALLHWGADVIGVDLPRPEIWRRVIEVAEHGAGRLHLPVKQGVRSRTRDDLAAVAGADLLLELPAAARWLSAHEGPLVLGNYVYADGAANVRVATAVDLLSVRLMEARPDLSLAFLATPTDVFAVPPEVVAHSARAYASRGAMRRPVRILTGGRLMQRNYSPDADPGINDSLVLQQGPNYALAKRLQRWRATVARQQGRMVSLHVAPPTRTRSVLKNRALAAAYAGSHRFGIEVFEPATSNTLMAALLVHDLHTDPDQRRGHPWQDEAFAAAPGGLWRGPYSPRSALGLAVLLGLGGARG